MKKSIFTLLAITVTLSFFSCNTDGTMTDQELIEAIQQATNKQEVTLLPADATAVLYQDFSESMTETSLIAPELGYEVNTRRVTGINMGERSQVYFNLEGRELRRDGSHDRRRGHQGRDWEECFDLVFPVTFIMPDGSEITGSAAEIRIAMGQWYDTNPDTREAPVLQFPVDIEFENGTLLTVNSYAEIRAAYENCD